MCADLGCSKKRQLLSVFFYSLLVVKTPGAFVIGFPNLCGLIHHKNFTGFQPNNIVPTPWATVRAIFRLLSLVVGKGGWGVGVYHSGGGGSNMVLHLGEEKLTPHPPL